MSRAGPGDREIGDPMRVAPQRLARPAAWDLGRTPDIAGSDRVAEPVSTSAVGQVRRQNLGLILQATG